LLGNALIEHPARTAASLGYLALGVPMYFAWSRRASALQT
jgi:hypothetical protein